MNRRSVLKAVGIAGATGLAGCLGSDEAMDEVMFGQPSFLSGGFSAFQQGGENGVDLALEEINETDGPAGMSVDISRRDTETNAQVFREVVEQLVHNDDSVVLLQSSSADVTANWDLIVDLETPFVNPWPTTPFLDQRGGDKGDPQNATEVEGWFWRPYISDTIQIIGTAAYLERQDVTDVGVFAGDSATSQEFADGFEEWWQDLDSGYEVSKLVTEAGKSDYSTELREFFDNDFEAWILVVEEEDGLTILNQWDEQGYSDEDHILIGDTALSGPALIEDMGETAEGMVFVSPSVTGPNRDTFLEKWDEKGYEDDNLFFQAIAMYDAVNVSALAIHRASLNDDLDDLASIREGIQKNVGPVSRSGGTEVATFEEGMQALDDGDEINYQGAATDMEFTDHGNIIPNLNIEELTPDGYETADTINREDYENMVEGEL